MHHDLAALAAFTLGLLAGLAIGLRGHQALRHDRRTLRQDLARERVTSRLQQAAWARDVAALQPPPAAPHPMPAEPSRACREAYVLAQTALILDAAYAAQHTDQDRGGTDGC